MSGYARCCNNEPVSCCGICDTLYCRQHAPDHEHPPADSSRQTSTAIWTPAGDGRCRCRLCNVTVADHAGGKAAHERGREHRWRLPPPNHRKVDTCGTCAHYGTQRDWNRGHGVCVHPTRTILAETTDRMVCDLFERHPSLSE